METENVQKKVLRKSFNIESNSDNYQANKFQL